MGLPCRGGVTPPLPAVGSIHSDIRTVNCIEVDFSGWELTYNFMVAIVRGNEKGVFVITTNGVRKKCG